MILPIYLYGQPVLKKVAEDITAEYPNLQDLIANMFDTMHQAQGLGLAAPQIGLAIRLVVVDLDVLAEDEPEFKAKRSAWDKAFRLRHKPGALRQVDYTLTMHGETIVAHVLTTRRDAA